MTDTAKNASTPADAAPEQAQVSRSGILALSLGSMGVVYGDIGTSPLYAFREAVMAAAGDDPISRDVVLGVLSLILWSLIIVVTAKYVLLLLRADNNGEGGTLSLVALAGRALGRRTVIVSLLGVLGFSMFLGDSVITPAISVLSAMEGLKLAVPAFDPYVEVIARKQGPMGLEKVEADDPFLAKGIRFIADGYDADFIRDNLERDRDNFLTHLDEGQKIYRAIGDCAPAFGMIGTLIGMVQMFANMTDPSKLGPFMATALLATLYGALVANIFCLPIADKLHLKLVDEEINRTLIIDGILMIRDSKSPTLVREMLIAYLPEKHRHTEEEGEPVPA